MSRPALAAARAVSVLDFLASHPTDSFTLSDLAGRLDVNLASMHSLLAVLVESGYVLRHGRLRTYTLGPSVVALGTAALECHPAIDRARDAGRALAERTGLETAVTAVAGDQIVHLARSGEPTPHGASALVGQRIPLVPPLGAVFLAWGDAADWLRRSNRPAALAKVLQGVRERGYAVALDGPGRRRLEAALHDLADHPTDPARREAVVVLLASLETDSYHPPSIAPRHRYDVSMISAPIFAEDGTVLMALTLVGFEGGRRGHEVIAYGEMLRDAALVVTRRTRGRVPPRTG
ncbi:MAG: helix-turn-helix domain-containing protein [Acidobacteriota bacterium]|nr:helix-turn-helix domain-containing protein [Acidobacteriota bacterium]